MQQKVYACVFMRGGARIQQEKFQSLAIAIPRRHTTAQETVD
jgi:hypothetical protein